MRASPTPCHLTTRLDNNRPHQKPPSPPKKKLKPNTPSLPLPYALRMRICSYRNERMSFLSLFLHFEFPIHHPRGKKKKQGHSSGGDVQVRERASERESERKQGRCCLARASFIGSSLIVDRVQSLSMTPWLFSMAYASFSPRTSRLEYGGR